MELHKKAASQVYTMSNAAYIEIKWKATLVKEICFSK